MQFGRVEPKQFDDNYRRLRSDLHLGPNATGRFSSVSVAYATNKVIGSFTGREESVLRWYVEEYPDLATGACKSHERTRSSITGGRPLACSAERGILLTPNKVQPQCSASCRIAFW